MADVFSAIILDDNYWGGPTSYAGEVDQDAQTAKYGDRRFTSPAAWEADRDGASSGGDDEYGIIIGPWASPDTAQCYINTWGADNIIVDCPVALPDGDNLAAHDGIYGNKANAYRNEYTSGNNFHLRNENVRVVGVQVKNIYDGRAGFRLRVSSLTQYIQRCVIDAVASGAFGIFDSGSSDINAYIENTVITAQGNGINLLNTAAGHIINCTINGLANDSGIVALTAVKVRNCAVFNNGDDFTTVTDVSYCASDDGDGVPPGIDWDAEATDWAANFTEYTTYDYTPLDVDLPDAGVGPGTDGDVPTTDCIGIARSGATCTIGAFEFAVVGSLVINVSDSLTTEQALD